MEFFYTVALMFILGYLLSVFSSKRSLYILYPVVIAGYQLFDSNNKTSPSITNTITTNTLFLQQK